MGETIKLVYDLFKIYSENFYKDLMTYDFATLTALITVGVTLLTVLIYYYAVDRPATSNLKAWSIFLIANAVILAFVAYSVAKNTLVDEYLGANQNIPDYETDFLYFSLTNAFFTSILFLIISILVKFKSTNSSHIPF